MLWVIVDGGQTFEGSIEQFKECFFSNANPTSIKEWANKMGSSVEFSDKMKNGIDPVLPPYSEVSKKKVSGQAVLLGESVVIPGYLGDDILRLRKVGGDNEKQDLVMVDIVSNQGCPNCAVFLLSDLAHAMDLVNTLPDVDEDENDFVELE